MLTDDIKAITQLIDVIASKLGGPEHAGRLAILRCQLLTLLREAARAEETALSYMASVGPRHAADPRREPPPESGVADHGRPPSPVAPYP
jgi:hypothetical protein